MDIKNRYKTLDGKTWENVKNLSDTELFIHINISATTCMARIANIMNKLSIPADVVRIKLK